jgi:hypothetical protein
MWSSAMGEPTCCFSEQDGEINFKTKESTLLVV